MVQKMSAYFMAFNIVHVYLQAYPFPPNINGFQLQHKLHTLFFSAINTEAWEARTSCRSLEVVVHYTLPLPISYSGCFSRTFELQLHSNKRENILFNQEDVAGRE